ncbi:MAG: ImmA/IrrE family metallo-endopeptidase [Nitrospiraceae bacterium]
MRYKASGRRSLKRNAPAGAVGVLAPRTPIHRIPLRVMLPFGYRIVVKQLTDSEMDARDPNADGEWDCETRTIYIRKRLPMTRRRYILAHELGHAWLDWQHRYLDSGKAST